MSKMSETWINIEDNIEIMNQVVDMQLYDIDNQDDKHVFLIEDDSEYDNHLFIVPEEDNNDTKMEIIYFLGKIKSQ